MSTLPQRSLKKVNSLNANAMKITLASVERNYKESPSSNLATDLEQEIAESLSFFDTSAAEDDCTHESSSTDEERRTVKKIMPPFRAWCYHFFVLSESWQARAFYLISHILLLLMVISFCLETIPSIYQTESNEWKIFSNVLDITLLIILSTEFAGKLYGWPNRWRFFFNYKNMLDVLTIIPFIIVTFFESVASSHFLRVLRLLKVFTLLKIFRVNQYSPGIYVTTNAIKRSLVQILVVSLYLLVAILISSSLVFFVEQSEYDKLNRVWVREVNGHLEPSPFQSIVHAFYWSVVTLTTTGYGDVVPVTNLGKMIAGFTMICGVLVIALPTSIIGSNLVSEWENYNRIKFQMEFKHLKSINQGVPIHSLKEKRQKDKALRQHNKQMMNLISEIQERLYDINPPHYYVKYKRLSSRYLNLKRKVALLEAELERYKKITRKSDDIDQSNDYGIPNMSNFLLPFRRFRTESSVRADNSLAPVPRRERRRSILHTFMSGNSAPGDQATVRRKNTSRLSTNSFSGPFSLKPHKEIERNEEISISGINSLSQPYSQNQSQHLESQSLQYSQTDHSIDYSSINNCTPKHINKSTISCPFAPRPYSSYIPSEHEANIPNDSALLRPPEISTPNSPVSIDTPSQHPEYHSVSIDPKPLSPL